MKSGNVKARTLAFFACCKINFAVWNCFVVLRKQKRKNMKEKFEFIYNTVKMNMEKLDKKQISVDQAKAMASLAKQANNVLTTQLDAGKFIANIKDAKIHLNEVGL